VAAQQRKQQEQYHKAQAAAAAAPPQQQQHQSTSHHRHHAPSVSSSISDVSTPTVTIAPAPDPTHTPAAMSANGNIVTRVRALHTFEPTEPGELAFEKGDIIKVVDRGYKDWWRGQLKGRTGIFPVNYVVRRLSSSFLCRRFSICPLSCRNPCLNLLLQN
jgi:signal transducing adaptor molecule